MAVQKAVLAKVSYKSGKTSNVINTQEGGKGALYSGKP
tara:strand:+ start:1154 stop:1267 length:114 start_codon:yes stop_codon:yes gene_type:complete